MKAHLLLLAVLVSVSAMSADDQPKTIPQPEGQPAYVRGNDELVLMCWLYTGAQVAHCRLHNKVNEVFGNKDGETIKTNFGDLI
jgi:hypothetical protein